jgi:histidyl-tRNA synthetase
MEGEGVAYLNNLRSLVADAVPGIAAPLDELAEVAGTLAGIGVAPVVAPLLVRDFEYYTGPAFQLFAGETKVGGGGRYDALISQIGGKNLPASGFALEMEPLLTLVADAGVAQSTISIRCEAGGKAADAFALAVALRRKDFAVAVGGAEAGRQIVVSGDGFTVSLNGSQPRRAATVDETVALVAGG